MNSLIWKTEPWLLQAKLILNSYKHWLGEDLIVRSGDLSVDAENLFYAKRVVVSHGTQADPILNYGNRAALDLWEMEVDVFCSTPSKNTAEPMHRDERANLLDRTTRDGYVDDYSGIRITSTGQRFFVEDAIVFNLLDDRQNYVGQAATFYTG